MNEKYFTVKEVANYFKVTVQAVHKWINEGKMECIKTPGGEKRISEKEIDKIISKAGK